MLALPTPAETGTRAGPGAAVVGHSVGIPLAALNLVGANVTRYSGCFTLLHDHILANLVQRQRVRHLNPVLTGHSPLLTGSISVEHWRPCYNNGKIQLCLRRHVESGKNKGVTLAFNIAQGWVCQGCSGHPSGDHIRARLSGLVHRGKLGILGTDKRKGKHDFLSLYYKYSHGRAIDKV
jgi:hypothetical protein